MGQSLGRLAHQNGYEIGDVVCRTLKSARDAVRFIGAGVPQGINGFKWSPAAVTLITTPDDSIPSAVELLINRKLASPSNPLSRPTGSKPVVLHTSGALSSRVLNPLRRHGYSVGSCHPLQTFESPAGAVELISKSFFCIEGDAEAVKSAVELVKRIGGHSFKVRTEQKELYHAAAVLASGGLIGLVSISLEALQLCGLSEDEARTVLIPLVYGTVGNLQQMGPSGALTGPVRRRDAGTIRKNLAALSKVNPDWAALYSILARRGLALTNREDEKKSDVKNILKILD